MRNPLPLETWICLIDPRGRGGALSGDSGCPIEFICEHYLTFSKSLLHVILCLLGQKNYLEILKNETVFERGKGQLENAKGREHESIFTFKMVFRMLSNCFTTSRALFRLQQKDVTQSISRLKSRVNLQVRPLAFYFLHHEELFPKNIQN